MKGNRSFIVRSYIIWCFCRDWDDPRLFTLTALRRRGFPPEAINNFCARVKAQLGCISNCFPISAFTYSFGWLNTPHFSFRWAWLLLKQPQSPTCWKHVWEMCLMTLHPGSWLSWILSKWPSPICLLVQRCICVKHNICDRNAWYTVLLQPNLISGSQTEIRVPNFPADESKGSHVVPFSKTIFIEQSDFREVRVSKG